MGLVSCRDFHALKKIDMVFQRPENSRPGLATIRTSRKLTMTAPK
jgi:hypothetical protein